MLSLFALSPHAQLVLRRRMRVLSKRSSLSWTFSQLKKLLLLVVVVVLLLLLVLVLLLLLCQLLPPRRPQLQLPSLLR